MEIAKDTKIPFILVTNGRRVSYKDETGKIRTKYIEKSDENYREIENKPITGLKVNGHSGGNYSRWHHYSSISKEYVEIADPRGFYINISVPNFLYIVANSTIENGLIKDEMIWSWNKGDVLLMPTKSEDYKEVFEYSKLLNTDKKYSTKDLVVGKKYLLKGNKEVYYLGRHQYYKWTKNVLCESGYKWNGASKTVYETKKSNAHYVIEAGAVEKGIDFNKRSYYYSITPLTVSNIIDDFDNQMSEEEINLCVELIYTHGRFNPIDYMTVKRYEKLPYEQFVEELEKVKNKLNLKLTDDSSAARFCVENDEGICFTFIKFMKADNVFSLKIETLLRTENDKTIRNYNMFSSRRPGTKNLHSSCIYVNDLNDIDDVYKKLYKSFNPVKVIYTSEDEKNVFELWKY